MAFDDIDLAKIEDLLDQKATTGDLVSEDHDDHTDNTSSHSDHVDHNEPGHTDHTDVS